MEDHKSPAAAPGIPSPVNPTTSGGDDAGDRNSPTKHRGAIVRFLLLLFVVAVLVGQCVWYLAWRQSSRELRELREEQAAALDALRAESAVTADGFDLDRLLALDKLFTDRSLSGVADRDALTDALLDAYVAATGDLYAAHYTNDEYYEQLKRQNGSFVGIGVLVLAQPDSDALLVLSVYEESPALEAGIQPGDLLTAVDGVGFEGLSAETAAGLLVGDEGTSLNITYVRAGTAHTAQIIRRAVTETTVTSRMLAGNIGYVRIRRFANVTPTQFAAAMTALEDAGATSYVFDVRSNPGGLLNATAECLGYLLPDGPVVRVNYKNEASGCVIRVADGILYREYPDGTTTVRETSIDLTHILSCPIAVLTNGATASAAEAFSATLRDYGAKGLVDVTLCGEKTYGKGVVQVIYRTGAGDALKLTVATYDPPDSENYDGIGLFPDLSVSPAPGHENDHPEQLTPETDFALARALSLLGDKTNVLN